MSINFNIYFLVKSFIIFKITGNHFYNQPTSYAVGAFYIF